MKTSLIFLFLFMFLISYGQFTEPKFGNVNMSDLTMTKYDKDTTAGALILFNFGTSNFIVNNEAEFQFLYQRHYQIKIFKKSAFGVADFKIRLSVTQDRKEELRNLKAYTYNLVGGKIVKTKLDNDKIYKTKADKMENVSFAMPDVKEGSIIELSYQICSDFLYNFRGWTFQYNYPALVSQYSYEIPEYFTYRESSKGYFKFDVLKKSNGTASFSVPTTTSYTSRSGYSTTKQGGLEIINASTSRTILALKDVPAFIAEPNIDCEDNYIQAIEFELSSVKYPGQMLQNFTETWESVNKKMVDDPDFGGVLKTRGFVRDTVSGLCSNKATDLEKAISIYNYVQSRMKWNGDYSLWALKGLKKPFTDRVGTSSEINLLLTMMLQSAGLKADPVLFSTRSNGISIAFFPTITNFNSVLTKVAIDGKTYLLDPTSKYYPFGLLPPEDINGRGRVVNDLTGDWAALDANYKYSEVKNYTLGINPDGKITGSISASYDGYAGASYRYSLSLEKSPDDYMRKVQENLKGLVINNFSISGRDNNYKPICDSLNVEISDNIEMIGDKVLFYPLLFEKIEKNRYTLQERKYPVNYNYPISEVYNFRYTIPAGYKIESLPKSFTLNLPDNSILITCNVKNTDNVINIEYNRNINKIIFLPTEYKALKDLFDQMVKKHSEQIILVKTV
jgi:hypothetical protein